MFQYLAEHLTSYWGPFRLLASHLFLIGFGGAASALLVGMLMPKLAACLPRDRGRLYAPGAAAAAGKPTGAGLLLALLLLPVLFLVMPFNPRSAQVTACLVLAMLCGYLDDRSRVAWGEAVKGGLDLFVAVLTALALCQGEAMTVWLPLVKRTFVLPAFWYVVLGSALLWLAVNATNCTDGVDGLAGSLALLSLFYLGILLYVVIGHAVAARYLLVPHNPEGAQWAALCLCGAGAVGGYLWHNAEPSRVLMGDAGSRLLGLLVGVGVLAAGNPFLILVVAPIILVNGGGGLVKLSLLRFFARLGLDVRAPAAGGAAPRRAGGAAANRLVNLLHRYRFPLHDHCRKNLGWSNAQVLMRFMLLQALLTPLLLLLIVKVR